MAATAVAVVVACGGDGDDGPDVVGNNNQAPANNMSSVANNTGGADTGNAFRVDPDDAFDVEAFFLGDATNDATTVDLRLTAPYDPQPNFAPEAGSMLLGSGGAPSGDFFTSVDFVGAVGSTSTTATDGTEDWTRTGWTILRDETAADRAGGSILPSVIASTCVPNAEGVDVCRIPTNTEATAYDDFTLGPDKIFEIDSGSVEATHVFVRGTMTLLPGATVFTQSETAIVIMRDGRIEANGTLDRPITFTSRNRRRGAWGGLIIRGRAPAGCGTSCEGEGGSGSYGGDDPTDDSGTLRYVRVRYAGADGHDGVAFFGVGSETEVDYVEVYQAAGDGVEFFGGTVGAKHLLILAAGDDAFGWALGWQGNLQFLASQQQADVGEPRPRRR